MEMRIRRGQGGDRKAPLKPQSMFSLKRKTSMHREGVRGRAQSPRKQQNQQVWKSALPKGFGGASAKPPKAAKSTSVEKCTAEGVRGGERKAPESSKINKCGKVHCRRVQGRPESPCNSHNTKQLWKSALPKGSRGRPESPLEATINVLLEKENKYAPRRGLKGGNRKTPFFTFS